MADLKKVHHYLLPLSYLLLIQVVKNVAYGVNKDDVLQIVDVRLLSSPTLKFQTSVEFIRFECGSHFKASHLVISNPLSGCTVPYPPAVTTNNQWTLLISDDEDSCHINTRLRNAANAGYSAIIIGTTKKYADTFPNITGMDPEYLDSYLVNPWDFRILSRYAYPNSPDYASFVIPNPPLDRFVKSRNLCKEERAKMFYERQYYHRSHLAKFMIQVLDSFANLINAVLTFPYFFFIVPASWPLELVIWPMIRSCMEGFSTEMRNFYEFIDELTGFQWVSTVITILTISFMWRKYKQNWKLTSKLARLRSQGIPRCDDCPDREVVEKERENLCSSVQELFAEEFQCTICWEVLLDGVQTACGHQFCGGCLKCWCWENMESPECPLCRAPFKDQPKPSLCTFNEKIDDIFDLIKGSVNQERKSKRVAFQQMQPPNRNVHLDFESLTQLIQQIIRNARRENGSQREMFPDDSDEDSSDSDSDASDNIEIDVDTDYEF